MVSTALWDSTEGNVCIWPHTSLWEPGSSPPSGQHVLLEQAWASCWPIPSKAFVTWALCSCSQPPLQNLSQVCHLVILIGAVTLLTPSQFLFQICVMAWCHFPPPRAVGKLFIYKIRLLFFDTLLLSLSDEKVPPELVMMNSSAGISTFKSAWTSHRAESSCSYS